MNNVWSVGPDGHEYAMKDKDFADVGPEGGGIASSRTTDIEWRVPRVAIPSGVIAFEYEQRARPFVTEKTWYFQGRNSSLEPEFYS